MTRERSEISGEELMSISNRKDLIKKAEKHNINVGKYLRNAVYEEELRMLQTELVSFQQWVYEQKKRVVIIFEGRDASGKGGTIKRFKEHMNPRTHRVVALKKPTEEERGQWYFRRYIQQLPNPGEVTLFDRSWYNRAVVEPVMGFCTQKEYNKFLIQVPEFEHMLYEDGVHIIKLWFSIDKKEQSRRFARRQENPLKQWKFSNVDKKGQELWDQYSFYKEEMFSKSHSIFSPWIIVKSNDKKMARLESIRYVLANFNYPGKGDTGVNLLPDPNIVFRYHRNFNHA